MSALDKKTVVSIAVAAVGVLMLASAGIAHYGRNASVQKLAEQERQLEMLQQQFDRALERPAEQPVTSEQRWHLCDGPEVVTTMQRVQALGDGVGVCLDGLTAKRSAERCKQAFEISGYGEPGKVCAFVAAIEQDARLMVVETGRLTPAHGDQVAFQFGLATYYEGEAK